MSEKTRKQDRRTRYTRQTIKDTFLELLKQKNVEELYIHNRITFQRAFEKYIDTWRNRENWEINCSLCRIYFVLYCFI